MKIILHNSFVRHEHHIKYKCDAAIKEIFKKIIQNLKWGSKVKIYKVDYKIPSFKEIKLDFTFSPTVLAPRLWVDIYINWKTDLNDKDLKNKLLYSKLNKYQAALFKFTGEYERQLQLALLASNISFPGVASYMGGLIKFADVNYFSFNDWGNYLLEHVEEYRYLEWPKNIDVSFEQAWNWVYKIFSLNSDVSYSRVSRALAAYSMIACGAEEQRSQLLLFWAMMGLEALYCEGSEGFRHQIFEKSQVVLGPIKENKKISKKMYDIRSKYVHGAMDIPYVFSHNYESIGVDKFREEIYRAESIAIKMLISSLQFMVLTNKDELDFKYSLL